MLKGEIKLLDGRKVPEIVGEVILPIHTDHPAAFAIIDLTSGNVFRTSCHDCNKLNDGTVPDFELIKSIIDKQLNDYIW